MIRKAILISILILIIAGFLEFTLKSFVVEAGNFNVSMFWRKRISYKFACAHANTPFVAIYKTSNWSKIADPATLPNGNGTGVAFNANGSLMAVSHYSPNPSPRFVTIYNTSNWSKLADPAILPNDNGRAVTFNLSGTLMAVGHASPNPSPRYITIYNTSNWSKLADPSVLPADDANNLAFSPNGQLLAVAHYSSPILRFITPVIGPNWPIHLYCPAELHLE